MMEASVARAVSHSSAARVVSRSSASTSAAALSAARDWRGGGSWSVGQQRTTSIEKGMRQRERER